jgi:hypothetical protein
MRTFTLIALLPLTALAESYGMADLKALEKDLSWAELVDHLTDVQPVKRDAEWRALAERACSAVLDPAAIKDVPTAQASLAQMEALFKRFGWLKESKVFMARRAEVGLKALGFTYQTSRHSSGDDPWLDSVKAFVAADQVTPDIALRGAKVMTARLIPIVAFPLLRQALAKGGAPVCKDPDLQRATLAAIAEGSWPAEADEVLTTCWDELKPQLVAEVNKPDATRTSRLKLCPVLLKHKGLTAAEEKARCTFE